MGEDSSPPPGTTPGSWRPDPTQFASFATAAALRYDGRFPDPLHPGAFLPRVRYWQPWNEPNLAIYLSPQWTSTSAGWAPASPVIYRQLLNAFYGAVKRVSSQNFVVTAGTAPYGDPPGGQRMPPVAFDRALFCLEDDAALTPLSCPNPPHLDALSHHPYGIGGPLWHALNPDDAAVPDMYKIARRPSRGPSASATSTARRPQAAVGHGDLVGQLAAGPGRRARSLEQARWLEQALYVLWRQGVGTVLWLQIVDSPPIPNYGSTYQAGLYYLDGDAKPAAQAFRFPFVTRRVNAVTYSGVGPLARAGTLAIEELRGGRWVLLRRLSVRSDQVFTITLPVRGRAVLRAQCGAQTSLAWTQRG